ncbi:hypothetical protein ACDL59_04210 [Corynebacterium diphtheriae]|uniref:hypothetical protein n=1 Tax=Corynebacterium diphtheriae TaxID=1717 RepID=UPI0002467CEF|nr:hypothetical protein [Corynebacterium diphtheriae]AEX76033.1 hypothetical protein CDHC02_0537 [Corynebacterium diphtheriae HC02]MBG9252215.1 hypothetical protein [Corynebacterium diphtheriae bv. mitis]MBG9297241.1 hypothetical protein [Corynebacterium diphtheriae bv. gravis]MBG9356116.1 hypothetical protein [Corynebacterium diphtheriae bv. mitis]TBX18817.1 hypothetical protein BUW94_05605 [Corynebacterium diphtheriae]
MRNNRNDTQLGRPISPLRTQRHTPATMAATAALSTLPRSQNNLPDTTPLVFLEVGIRDASEFYSPITITGHVG